MLGVPPEDLKIDSTKQSYVKDIEPCRDGILTYDNDDDTLSITEPCNQRSIFSTQSVLLQTMGSKQEKVAHMTWEELRNQQQLRF